MIRRVSNLLLPITPEIVLYVIISIFLLGLGTIKDLLALIFGERQLEWQALVYTTIGEHWSMVQGNTPKLATAAIMIFWSIVGTIVYTFVWSSANVSMQVKDDIEVGSQHFIHPKTWTAKQYWLDIISQSMVQALTCFVLIILFISTIKVVYPFSIMMFQPLVATGRVLPALKNALIAILLMAVVVYFAAILIRLLLRRASW